MVPTLGAGPGELALKPQCSLVGQQGEASLHPWPAQRPHPPPLVLCSLRGPSCSADHLPGPASPSSLQRDKENSQRSSSLWTAVSSANPAVPLPRGGTFFWGLRLVTPPDLPTSVSDQEPRSLSSKPQRGVFLADLGSELLLITPISPTAGTVGDIMGQDTLQIWDTSALSSHLKFYIFC